MDLIIIALKISIIVFSAIFLISSILPFYDYDAPYFNAIASINLSNGIYSFSNELLQETGRNEFVGANWAQTEQNDIIPRTGPRTSVIGSLFFVIGGYYGLLYLTPIFGILFLIFSERIATNFFGKYVGLLTLLFLATSNLIFRNSIRLQSDVVYSVFIILGCFFILHFLRDKKDWSLLTASSIFTFASVIRLNGIVFFPVEILIVGGYFLIKTIKNRNNSSSESISSKIFQFKTIKCIGFLLLPWLLFIAGYIMYHDYYFGDPFTNYLKESNRETYDSELSSLFSFEKQDFENSKAYSKYLLPYQFAAIHNQIDNNYDNILGDNWPGIILQIILFSILIYSLFTKKKRIEIITLILLIIVVLWFQSTITSSERAAQGVAGRYMIPIFAFSSMMISYIIVQIFGILKHKQNILKFLRPTFGIIIGIFFISSFYFLPSIQMMFNDEFQFNDPQKILERYPLDKEGLTDESVIVTNFSDPVLDYGAIPFKAMTKGEISLDSVNLLKQIVSDGSDVYIFKRAFNQVDKEIILELMNHHGISLKDFSSSFCKIEITSNVNATSSSDKICYELETIK